MSSEGAANHTWRGQGEKISLSTNKGQSFSSEVSFTGNVRPLLTWHPGTRGGLDVTVRRCLPRSLAGNALPAAVGKELTLRLPAVFTALFRSPWDQPPGLGVECHLLGCRRPARRQTHLGIKWHTENGHPSGFSQGPFVQGKGRAGWFVPILHHHSRSSRLLLSSQEAIPGKESPQHPPVAY